VIVERGLGQTALPLDSRPQSKQEDRHEITEATRGHNDHLGGDRGIRETLHSLATPWSTEDTV